MISAFRRKLGGGKDAGAHPVMPPGVSRVDNELQKKYARGVQYNMKIVIRGDRNVGKSCLLKRLQGLSFCEEYVPTEEIQVVNIHWNYRATDDVVKVDVWDIVDQSTKKKVRNDKLKLTNNSTQAAAAAEESLEDVGCDARFVDVYKGAHGVVLMFDLTKLWTWEYVQKEIDHVPPHIPVLILANRRDMGHHRVVTNEMCDSFVEGFNSALCIPSMNAGLFDISDVPWTVIARHGSALVLYGIAIAQWPGLMVSDWAGEDRAFAYHLTSIMFTLSFWCAFFYHYLVSAGRVQIDWKTGKLKGKGWIVRTSRRAHRVLLSLTLAVSAMSIIQSITIAMIITHFYIKEDELEAKEHAILILLKIDQTLAFCIFIFVLGRLIFEPVSIRKHRRRSEAIERVGDPKQVLGSGSVDSLGLPEEAEECNICVENWANRILGCGHLLCCCCLAEIWKTGGYTTIQCPYCRANVNSIHKIRLSDGGYVEISNCCDDFLEVVDSPSSTTMDDIVDPTIIVRPPPESHPMPDKSPRVRWTSSSMRNAFGLRLVHLFFNIPFLCLQRDTLKLQLERNREEIISSYSELDCYQETPEADYDRFMDAVTQKRRMVAESQGVKASAVTPSGRVMGGGQPIPGQNLSPEKTARKPSQQENASTNDTAAKALTLPSNVGKDSFEILGDEEDMDNFLDCDSAEKTRRPASLNIHHSSASDEENNTMVRTFEEDFYADDDLKEKMSKMAVEKKKIADSLMAPAPASSVTPPAYRLKIESDNAYSSNDEYITPDRTDSDGTINFTAQTSPVEPVPPEIEPCVAQTTDESYSAFTADDLDEWLGKDDANANIQFESKNANDNLSSDEEIGVKLPVVSSSNPLKFSNTTSESPKPAIVPMITEEKPKKKKKKSESEGEKLEKKVKTKDGTTKKKKRSSSKTGRTTKSPQVTLEEFLGGPISHCDDEDYDPL